MEYIIFGVVTTFIWMVYEVWRAPMMDERTGKIIRPTKKLKDLFKTKTNQNGSYSDLEKKGRGRSKY